MQGLGAKLGSAEIGGTIHFLTRHEVLEERQNIEVRKGGHVFGSNKAENLLAGLVVQAVDLAVLANE